MTASPRWSRLLLPLLATGALATGCGGDDEPASVTVPTTTEPKTQSTTGKSTTDETTAPETDSSPQGDSGDSGPSGGTRVPDSSRPDSPENDIPPLPGSPAERFEQECQVNPQACQ